MDVKIELPQHYIEIEGSLVQRRLRSLKHGDAFAVFDEYGDIGVIGAGSGGTLFQRYALFVLVRTSHRRSSGLCC